MAVKACARCMIVLKDETTERCPKCGRELMRVSEESVPADKRPS